MNPNDPLEVVHSIARDAADQARRGLGASLAGCRGAEERLRLLERYRDEYEQRLAREFQAGLSATALANYRQFLDRLAAAISEAVAEVRAWHARVAAGQADVRVGDRKVKSFDALVERRDRVAAAAEARRDQKQTDEFAARCAATRPPSGA